MFSKTPKTAQPQAPLAPPRPPLASGPQPLAAAPAPQPRPAPRPAASVLGSGLVFEGTVTGEGDLQLDGVVKGDVHVARLVVGETARLEGHIRCAQVEVRGRVVGDIEAQAVKLYETAYVEGDITHGQLSIDVGAYFQGRCQQFRQTATPTPAPAPAALPMMSPETTSAQVIALDGTAH